jgi:hypothetical protein
MRRPVYVGYDDEQLNAEWVRCIGSRERTSVQTADLPCARAS